MATDSRGDKRPQVSFTVGAAHEVVPYVDEPGVDAPLEPEEERVPAPTHPAPAPEAKSPNEDKPNDGTGNGHIDTPRKQALPAPADDTKTNGSIGSRWRNARNRRPKGSLGLKPYAYLLAIITSLILLLFVLHGTLKLIFVGLLLLAATRKVVPKVLDRFRPKKHNPPEDVPTRLVRGIYWKLFGKRLHARLGWEWLAKRSKKQQLLDNGNKLWDVRWIQIIVAFANLKGGSAKTAICVWLVALYAKLTESKPLAIDVNENAGHTASRLGIKRDSEAKDPEREGTIEMREYLVKCIAGKLDHKEDLIDVVDWHRETGVMVIASNAVSTDDIDHDSMRKGLRVGKHHVNVVFTDCGNDLKRPGNLNAVRMAGRLVFCGNSHMAGSCVDFGDMELPDDLKNTMATYTSLGLGDKVKAGILVIIGKLRDRKKYAEHYGFPLERVFVIPFNRYMKDGKEVKLKKIPLRVLVVLSDILVAIMDEDNDFLYEYDGFDDFNLQPALAGSTDAEEAPS
jgi:MinD-like ATPase involved in chromosome partitioning or flagellar assembly